MNNHQKIINQLNQLLLSANQNLSLMKHSDAKSFPNHIQTIEDYAKIRLMKRDDFYDFDFSKKKYAYIKHGRFDENGQEPIVPFTKKDFERFVHFESERFKKIGVTKNDRVTIVDFTLNETIPFASAIIQIGATYVVTEGDVENICRDLETKKVNVIFTYPAMLDQILLHLENRYKSLNLKMIILSGEALVDRKIYSKRMKLFLGTDFLVDTIGTREVGGYAYQCPSKNYFHFLDDLYIEVVDPKTKKPTDGTGELVITPLWRKELPLIRFTTQDLVHLQPKTCSCIVTNDLVFEHILGRTGADIKIGYSLIDLKEIYIQARYLLHYQYPFFDNVIWRLRTELNLSLLLTRADGVDYITLFVERKDFNLFFRKRRFLTQLLSNKFKVFVDVALISANDMTQFQKKYADLRFTEKNRIPPSLLHLMKKHQVGLFHSSSIEF